MIERKRLVAFAVCLLASLGRPAPACQYNVREVGFVDVGIESYRLLVYLPESISADESAKLKEAMAGALIDTNIRFEPVMVGTDANQPALEYVKAHGIDRFPAAVLVSPDGQSMPVTLPENTSLSTSLTTALKSILESPTRRQILEKCAEGYGVVLLLEGLDPQLTQTARETVSAAISGIGAQLESLPKPISKPPALVVLDQASLARERVLLWTLRLKAEDVRQPQAAVFYGRGRWIGPLVEGEHLTSGNLMQLLSVVGADCECSLDHRWLQGTMLPVRWDEALQQKVVQSTGFDPENPMTKMEMLAIVRRGLGGTEAANGESSDYPSVPFDYREIQVGGAAEEEGGQRAEDGGPKAVSPAAAPPLSSRMVGQVLAGSLAGIALLVGLLSLVIVLRARRP